MRENTNSDSYLRANPNPRISDLSTSNHHARCVDEPAAAAAAASAVSNGFSSLNRKSANVSSRGESTLARFVTFDIAAYSRRELKELKKRLISELQQIRNLSNRIEWVASKLAGSYGEREVASATRRSSLQVNQSSDWSGAEGMKEKRTPKTNTHRRPNEFVMGKDMMPPDTKKVSGIKRPLPSSTARKPKRSASKPAIGKLFFGAMERCRQILTKLMKHKHSWIFNVPVDVVGMGLHDYDQIIKHPMDLGIVKSKLGRNLYASPTDFASDVRLTFNNALLYNPKGHNVYAMAEQLLAHFEDMFEAASKKFIDERQLAIRSSWSPERESTKKPNGLPSARRPDSIPVATPVSNQPLVKTSTPKTAQVLASVVTRTGRQPKPKAKDPNKRDMSSEEKQNLGLNLQSLPPEKMNQVVEIIRKRNGLFAQDDDEIELDIGVVDTETLWELDRFVDNYKKLTSKIKRQALVSKQNPSPGVVEAPVSKAPEAAATVKNSRKGQSGEEEVDIGEEMPTSNFPPVEIDKDATGCVSSSRSSGSSSSSSNDSSSSSDSDSGSSSGSDSEET